MSKTNKTDAGCLSLVATPIGNLSDISKRAISTLKKCDEVYCEDTRVTSKLLASLGVNKPLSRMDENKISSHLEELIFKLNKGEHICYCTDAGMPGISDPGSRIVRACREHNIQIEVLPGANACLTALVLSGFDTKHFFMEGFLPKKKSQKEQRLKELMKFKCPVIIYESPKRVIDTVSIIEEISSIRRICVARELTKLHEEVIVNTSKEVLLRCREKLNCGTLKGEFVIVVDAPETKEIEIEHDYLNKMAFSYAKKMQSRGIRTNQLRSDLVEFFGCSKNEAYEISLKSKTSVN